MRRKLKRTINAYFSSWWLPLVLFFATQVFLVSLSLLDVMVAMLIHSLRIVWLYGLLLLLVVPAFWHLRKRRWRTGGFLLLSTPISYIITFYMAGFVASFIMFGGSPHDDFAKDLYIPEDIEITTPARLSGDTLINPGNVLQSALLEASQIPGSQDATIEATLPNLVALRQEAPNILWDYFTFSPAWRVHEERETRYATRRWQWQDSGWQSELHNSCLTSGDFYPQTIPGFQICFVLQSSPETSWYTDPSIALLSPDDRVDIATSSDASGAVGKYSSDVVITMPRLAIRLLEQSPTPERVLSKTILAYLEQAIAPLVDAPTQSTVRELLSEEGVRTGEPSIELWQGGQSGIYNATLWANPGEPGRVYLKAFEVTQGTPLSAEYLYDRSHEWLGWSDDPDELFLSNSRFTIYEGDWDDFYAARFEVWFEPDSGGSDRKLLERVFKIEGWQR